MDIMLFVLGMIFLLVTIEIFPTVMGSYQLYQGSVSNRSTDVSRENRLHPPETLPFVHTLIQLGFRRLGETHTPTPIKSDQATTWVFASTDDTIQAELISIDQIPMLQFTTVFADNAVIETIYPRGTTLIFPNYRSLVVRTTLEDAYQRHIAECETFSLGHGGCRRMTTLRDVLDWEPIYRELYAKKRLRGGTITSIVTLLWSIYSTGLFFVWGLLLIINRMTSVIQTILWIALTFTVSFLLYMLLLNRLNRPKTKGTIEL